MKLGILVNEVATERPGYSTSLVARTASARGHEVWLMGVSDLAYWPDESIHAHARAAPAARYPSGAAYLAEVQATGARVERLALAELDILLLRNNPAEEPPRRAWARQVGVDFGRLAQRQGVLVLNDPTALDSARNKTYLQLFPEEVRARTLVSTDREDLKGFVEELGGTAVLKPLQGSGGARVFVVRRGERANTNQMIEALTRDGYVIAQEYVEEGDEGDTRLFLMNGRPLVAKGRTAAFRRVRSSAGSFAHRDHRLERAVLTPQQLRVADIVRPKLVQDGMFLAALDFAGDRLIDINVFSPGGLGSAQTIEKVDFSVPVVEALERKVSYMGFYRRNFENAEMAVL